MRVALVAAFLLCAPSISLAQERPPIVNRAIADAERLCAQAGGKPSIRKGVVQSFLAREVWIVDLSKFNCSGARTLFCGSGGCGLNVIVKRRRYVSIYNGVARGWKLKRSKRKHVVALDLHGSFCGRAGYQSCRKIVALE
jgi:hypothetical protein